MNAISILGFYGPECDRDFSLVDILAFTKLKTDASHVRMVCDDKSVIGLVIWRGPEDATDAELAEAAKHLINNPELAAL